MDSGAWRATVCGVARVGLDLATEQLLLLEGLCKDEKKPDEGRRRCCQHVWDFQPLWYPRFSLELGEHMEAPPRGLSSAQLPLCSGTFLCLGLLVAGDRGPGESTDEGPRSDCQLGKKQGCETAPN